MAPYFWWKSTSPYFVSSALIAMAWAVMQPRVQKFFFIFHIVISSLTSASFSSLLATNTTFIWTQIVLLLFFYCFNFDIFAGIDDRFKGWQVVTPFLASNFATAAPARWKLEVVSTYSSSQGLDKLGLCSYDVASQARTLSADERLREPKREQEWARVSQRELGSQLPCSWLKSSCTLKNGTFCRETVVYASRKKKLDQVKSANLLS